MTRRRTLIIAEAGVNHNGDLELARRLIEAAVHAGADLVKFQTFVADRLATSDASKAEYQARGTDAGESQRDMLRRLELSRPMHEALIGHCAEFGIGFLSTAFDIQSLNLLAQLGLSLFKIPSGELTNLPYLRHLGRFAMPVVVSTGMANLGEIEAALNILESSGCPRDLITLLHCNTDYPTRMGDVNLRAMLTLQVAFGVPVGYSDHTAGIEVPIAAVALGASVIEKHITLDRELPGPDHRASLEPPEFAAMVRAIRNIENALGTGIKRPSQSESKNRLVARKSLVASTPIGAGEAYSVDNISAKRPGTGISPMRWDEVIGRKAPRNFSADEQIEL